MDDQEFDELKLRAMIAPHSEKWPTEYVHWQHLRSAITEARDRVGAACVLMAEIDADPDLSKEGKQRKRQKVAATALDEFQISKTLEKARRAVERQIQSFDEKIGMAIKPASNIHEATVHAQIRDRLFSMKNGHDRMRTLEQYGSDPVIASAVLLAPIFLSGLSDAEVAMVRHKVESHVDPAIIEARDATAKALKEAEVGWQRAQDAIGQRAGLVKNADETWSQTNQYKGSLATPACSR